MSGDAEQEPRGIDARDVRPGMIVWNPYGGPRGHAEVASEPRERPDGTIEFDCADGRTGHFRPQFRLRLDRAAMERRDAGAEAERLAGSDAGWLDEETRQAAEADAWGGRGPSASYAEWLAEGREPEAGGTAEVVREYRDVGGSLSAAALEAPDGARLTVSLPRGNVSGADPQVWARPEAYGLEQSFCRGHGSSDVCPYGAHDEIRLAPRELRYLAGRDAEREAGQ